MRATARVVPELPRLSGRRDVYTVGLVDWRGIPTKTLSAMVTHDRDQALRELERVRVHHPAARLLRRTMWLIVERE